MIIDNLATKPSTKDEIEQFKRMMPEFAAYMKPMQVTELPNGIKLWRSGKASGVSLPYHSCDNPFCNGGNCGCL